MLSTDVVAAERMGSSDLASSILAEIDRPDADIVLVPRDVVIELDSIESAPVGENRITRLTAKPRSIIQKNLAKLQLDSEPLLNDIVDIVGLLRTMYKGCNMELRLELVDKQTCPKFHCDNLFLRTLITYYGPTTEFIDVRSPTDIQSAPLCGLVFLKGHKHPSFQDRMWHRSPKVEPGKKRFCVVVTLFERPEGV